jgi:glycosyltransferase involved in cell wall biosynthesis
MKKILLATRPLTPPWDEASKNFAYFLAKSIREPELQMHILTTKSSSAREENRDREGASLEGLGENVVTHDIYPHYDATRAGHSFSQKAILSAYLFSQSYKYDIVHYLFTPTAFNSALITNFTYRRPKSIQTIATLREDLYGPEDWKKMLFADRIITYSHYSKAKLETAGFTGVECIYPGIDLELYSPKSKDADALKHFNLTEADFVVTYPGEYVRLGATDMLVEMLTKFLKKDSAIKFIFGNRVKNEADQKKKDEVVAKLTQAGIVDQVRFTDTWKEMPKLYNLSDVIVFPVGNMRGKFDIPLAIIEPYACEKPVILSDLEIFQEFSKPDFSVTIPRNDSDALWQAIEDLRANEDKRKTLGKNARAFTKQFFDLKETARKYETLYRE